MRTVVVIPAYNEERTVAEVVRRVREHTRLNFAEQNLGGHISDVVVIDDGSDDATGDRARSAGAAVVRHCVNRGLGAALGTGIAAALHMDADAIVTLDADGQHDPAEIVALVAPIAQGEADLVIGVRFSPPPPTPPPGGMGGNKEERGENKVFFLPLPAGGGARGGGAPWARHLFNGIANVVTRVLFGVRCSDTQSGFRCFSRRAAELIEIRTNRMEVSSEILAEAARHHLRMVEVPISTIYTSYSLSKGQGFTVGVRTAWALFLRKLF
ncbi:MAG: glycosyltransferase family 2 protein [Candidatus Uhrbacteria bacterium]